MVGAHSRRAPRGPRPVGQWLRFTPAGVRPRYGGLVASRSRRLRAPAHTLRRRARVARSSCPNVPGAGAMRCALHSFFTSAAHTADMSNTQPITRRMILAGGAALVFGTAAAHVAGAQQAAVGLDQPDL